MARVFFGKQSLMQRLFDIEVAAGEAMKRADAGLLKRKKGQGDPGLHNLVWRCAEIWESMTGRKASPHKVHTVDGDDSDFVKFLQCLVRLADGPKPSRKQIEISFKKAAPRSQLKNRSNRGCDAYSLKGHMRFRCAPGASQRIKEPQCPSPNP
jgi:hypothetical protein